MEIVCGVIGCGNISRFHFSGLQKAGARVKYVCDLNVGAAQPYRDQFNAIYTPNYTDIMADAEVNLVVITTFSPLHKVIALAAVAAQKAVICEKTLAVNAADALQITRAAQAAGVIFFTSYMKRFIPAIAKAKALMPELGTLISGTVRGCQCWGNLLENDAQVMQAWKLAPGQESWVKRNMGGGILVCGGSHLLDLVNYFFGRPSQLWGWVRQVEHLDFELQATVQMLTPSCPIQFEAVAHPLHKIGFLRDGWEEEITITGTQGRLKIYSALWDDPWHKASMLRYYDNRTGDETEFHFDAVSPFDIAVGRFCADIANGQQQVQSINTGYETDQVIEAIFASAASGNVIAIDWKL